MRYYFFDRHYGHDRVAQAAPVPKVKPGDFFEARWIGYGVCLGESVTRMEQYGKYTERNLEWAEILYLGRLFSERALEMLHWFTQHRFCTYKKAIPLRAWEIEELAKRMPKKKKKKWEEWIQTLHIYPNLRSSMNDSSWNFGNNWSIVLHSQTSKKQKAEAYRAIQSWKSVHIVCTYSQMFQDWQKLDTILLDQQHMRYYKNQQDPRYHAVDVAKKMAETYEANLELSGLSL